MLRKALLSLVALVACSSVASALTISETDDFSNFTSSPTIISQPFGVGINIVSGHVNYAANDFYDAFRFSLTPNTEIVRIDWDASNITQIGTYPKAAGFLSFTSGGNDDTALFYPNLSSTSVHFDSTLNYIFEPDLIILDPLRDTYASYAGKPYKSDTTWDLYPASDGASSFDWQFTFTVNNTVAPIPEPSTLILLGAGLAGLALWRRKRF